MTELELIAKLLARKAKRIDRINELMAAALDGFNEQICFQLIKNKFAEIARIDRELARLYH